jgi:hypothetical protein
MALKQVNVPEKKKPIAVICPQKKEKPSKHTKLEKNPKEAQLKGFKESEPKKHYVYIASISLLGEFV